jgi:hypothetical protein
MLHEGGGSRFFHNDATALHAVTFYTTLSSSGDIPQKKICTYMHRKTAMLCIHKNMPKALPNRDEFLVFLHRRSVPD